MTTTQRIKLTLAYEGTRYAGWQIQDTEAATGLPTIQSELEKALATLTGAAIRVYGAGRTDAGVHAEGQVAHFDCPAAARMDWTRALNSQLPPDIRTLQFEDAPPDFHSCLHAAGKIYCYTLWPSHQPLPPRLRAFCWQTRPLDVEAMREAAALFIGEHDFASFKNAGSPVKSTVRAIHSIDFRPNQAGPLACPEDWPALSLFFHGNGFLKQMIRNITGLLVQAGLGRISAQDVEEILQARDRVKNPCLTAPPQGLTMMRVLY